MQEMWVRSLGQEDSLEMEMTTHSSILARGCSKDREAWHATVHGVTKRVRHNSETKQQNKTHWMYLDSTICIKLSQTSGEIYHCKIFLE